MEKNDERASPRPQAPVDAAVAASAETSTPEHHQQQEQERPERLANASASGARKPKHKSANLHKMETQQLLGEVLVVPCNDSRYKAPVVTTGGEPNSVYSVIEKHFKQDKVYGPEKFWKVMREHRGLETWRPRVNGIQLKALMNVRLPETTEELEDLLRVAKRLSKYFKEGVTAEAFVEDVADHVELVQTWWENRNKRVADGSHKRLPSAVASPSAKHQKRSGIDGDKGASTLPSTMAAVYSAQGPQVAYAVQQIYAHHSKPQHPGQQEPGQNGLPSPKPKVLQGEADIADVFKIAQVNVGGCKYQTTLATLLTVPGSYFWNLVRKKESSLEYFIDRDGQLFSYILEYLRTCRYEEETHLILPESHRLLQALMREAEFYQLPELVAKIHNTAMCPPVSSRCMYDSLYLETGFKSIDGAQLKEMERCKVVVMQQMNHVLHLKQVEGFTVESCHCGVKHKEEAGLMRHNLFYHILLKKVVPVFTAGRML